MRQTQVLDQQLLFVTASELFFLSGGFICG